MDDVSYLQIDGFLFENRVYALRFYRVCVDVTGSNVTILPLIVTSNIFAKNLKLSSPSFNYILSEVSAD